MIYLDNAATSFPKPENVYVEIDKCMRNYCANPGRGSHAMSVKSAMVVNNSREQIANLLNITEPLNLSFTKNATEALNIAIYGCLSPGDHVITTCMEHNSVLRPLKTLERDNGINLTILTGDKYGEIDPQQIRKNITNKTKLIVCTLSSNVNGVIMPVQEISKIAQEHKIIFLLDASQGIGSINIDLSKLHANMVAFPGHKGLLGPQGTGCLYASPDIKLRPIMLGGTGSKSEYLYQPDILPDKYESGTLNTPGLAGLGAGVKFTRDVGIENIKAKKDELIKRLYDGIAQIDNIKIYSPSDCNKNSGIVAFNIGEMDSSEVAYALDKQYDIACRSGLHCAPLAHSHFDTLRSGIVRLSVGYFNTISDVDAAILSVSKIEFENGR